MYLYIRAMKIKIFLITALLLFSTRLLSQPYFQETSPETQGLSSEAILTFIERLEKEVDAVHSFMILRNGQLVSKGWWEPFGSDTPHVMHSLSKSFTSTAIGFAVQEELISLDDLVISFFPDKAPAAPTWHWNEMRVRDLLTMSTGHLEEPWARDAEDWVRYFLESEVGWMPGAIFKYNSMATFMLSAIITEVTGEKLVDYLHPRLFQPLGIKKPDWDEDPTGINTGGWGLRITTEAIAKLGQFYLQKGKWEGEQLLSEAWVDMATSKQASNGSNPNNDWTQGYGFQFWRCRHNAYRGDGAMGQFCIVMPDQQAVVAITSGVNDMGGVMNIVWETLLPAMKKASLSSDSESYEKLKNKTETLALKTVEGESRTSISRKVSTTYQMEENNAGLTAITLDVHGARPSVVFHMGDNTETVDIGWGTYLKSEVVDYLPYTDGLEKKTATSGAWIEENIYELRAYFYESPARVTYTLTFAEDELLFKTNLEHALFGRNDLEVIRGLIK